MSTRVEYEKQKSSDFLLQLLFDIDAWIDSLRWTKLHNANGPTSDREKIERILSEGFVTRISKLYPIISDAFKQHLALPKDNDLFERERIVLNDLIEKQKNNLHHELEVMGSQVAVSRFPQAVVQVEAKGQDWFFSWIFSFVLWWILDEWPDGRVVVDFVVNEEKAQIIFQDSEHIHMARENKGHPVLKLWEGVIEYLVIVVYHGWCIWPKPDELRRLEIILPVYPPTPEELEGLMPSWMHL
jgi:hypothetical protein